MTENGSTMILETDWVALFELLQDFTNLVPAKTVYKFGFRYKAPAINKPIAYGPEMEAPQHQD